MFATSAADASSFANSIASNWVSVWPKVMASLSTSQFSPTGLTCNDFDLFSISEDSGNGGAWSEEERNRITRGGLGAFPRGRRLTTAYGWLKDRSDGASPGNSHFVWSSLREPALAAST